MNSNPHDNLVGFGFWAYDYWDASGSGSNDFSAWTNWVTKGNPQPSTEPFPSSAFFYLAIVAAIVLIVIVVTVLLMMVSKKRGRKRAYGEVAKNPRNF